MGTAEPLTVIMSKRIVPRLPNTLPVFEATYAPVVGETIATKRNPKFALLSTALIPRRSIVRALNQVSPRFVSITPPFASPVVTKFVPSVVYSNRVKRLPVFEWYSSQLMMTPLIPTVLTLKRTPAVPLRAVEVG